MLLVEALHARGIISTELSRKILHLVAGLVLVIWPFFISWKSIVIIETIFIAVVGITRWLKMFGSQHGINRVTWGEFFFPIGVILAITLGAPRWVFILAILHLGLADSAAALVGTRYGKTNSYKVFGQKKSLAGSLAFFVVSVMLVGAVLIIAPNDLTSVSTLPLLLLPFMTTLSENLGAYGTDNLLIPLTVVLFLS